MTDCNIIDFQGLLVKKNCPKCGSLPENHSVKNYDPVWRDGDVHCNICGSYVRDYDAG